MMSRLQMDRPAPDRLHDHAADDLRFIRDTMARAADFTAVPGWGGVLMGATAIAAAWLSGPPQDTLRWLAIWITTALFAAVIGVAAIVRKARRSGVALGGAAVRRFALAFLPPLVAGAVFTVVFEREQLAARLPGCWLLCYGAAVSSGGAFSVQVVPLVGVGFMALGVLAFVAPPEWGHLFMAAGFGALHIGFGIIIARAYGG